MDFKIVIPVIISFVISVILAPVIIPFLRRLKACHVAHYRYRNLRFAGRDR